MHERETYHGSVTAYVAGFLLSLALTLGAYAVVTQHLVAAPYVIGTIVALAVIQLAVQLVFFLHVLKRGEFWQRVALLFTFTLLGIIVIGSLWIMRNLNGRMMLSPAQQIEYMHNQDDM